MLGVVTRVLFIVTSLRYAVLLKSNYCVGVSRSNCVFHGLLMPYKGLLPFNPASSDYSNLPIISLREVAASSASSSKSFNNKCNCQGLCIDRRCSRKGNSRSCFNYCHPKNFKCKNRCDLELVRKEESDCVITKEIESPIPMTQLQKRKLEVRSARAGKKRKPLQLVAFNEESINIIQQGGWLDDTHIEAVMLREQFLVLMGYIDRKSTV